MRIVLLALPLALVAAAAFAQMPAPQKPQTAEEVLVHTLQQQRDQFMSKAADLAAQMDAYQFAAGQTAKWWDEYVKGLPHADPVPPK